MPIEQVLAEAKEKIFSDIKIEMIRQGYTVSSLAELLNIGRPAVSFAIHGGTTPRDVEVRRKIYKVLGMED
ncbi:transcriptional regulator [Lactobacillus sp. XV13L]|nr:transcriptional regulator [Lactobacillus sp. XV13L]